MRLIIAECSVDYAGRLSAHLPRAKRLLVMKADGSVLVHSDSGCYKPLNWMNPPCVVSVLEPTADQAEVGVKQVWQVQQAKTDDVLMISVFEVISEVEHELGEDPGLIKDGVEKHLQELLADQLHLVEEGAALDGPGHCYVVVIVNRHAGRLRRAAAPLCEEVVVGAGGLAAIISLLDHPMVPLMEKAYAAGACVCVCFIIIAYTVVCV